MTLRRARRIASASLAALGTAVLAAACTLDVNAPDVVTPPALENLTGAEALRAGALNRFATIYAADLGQITVSGSLADEFTAAHPLVLRAVNSRATTPNNDDVGLYARLHGARLAAEEAAAAVQRFAAPGATGTSVARTRASELLSLAGFTQLFLAETYCAGVALSKVVDGETRYGEPLTRVQLLDSALAAFDQAVTLGGDSARVLHLARLGRARVLLALGRTADAAATVTAVPTSYRYDVGYAANNPRQVNGMFGIFNNLRHITVANREGGTGLDFVSAGDPRLVTNALGTGFDGTTPVFAMARIANLGSAMPLTSGVEARLIEAERQLANNDPTAALATLNALRAGFTPALLPLADPGNAAARLDLLFRERAFWLFATGTRHGDLRRLVRQYGRPATAVFPSGPYYLGGSYGTDVNVQIPITEVTNPRFSGCLDRNP